MSFIRKISQKNKSELTSVNNSIFIPDGVYILHETFGLRTVKGWNPKNNDGVVGILLVEGDHQIVVALEDSPENLHWSTKHEIVNQSVEELEDAKSDFNGEYYCRKLNSPDFPAAYYCLNYKKGGRSWYLPSSGELRLIYSHLDEIQNALETVGGQKFITTFDGNFVLSVHWSSTEHSATYARSLNFKKNGNLYNWLNKVSGSRKVRPISKFNFSSL